MIGRLGVRNVRALNRGHVARDADAVWIRLVMLFSETEFVTGHAFLPVIGGLFAERR